MSTGLDVSTLLGTQNLQVEVPFGEEVKLLINYVSREKMASIMGKATKKSWDLKHQPVEEFDHLLYGELLGLEALAGWSGLMNGKAELPCTPDNIKILMRQWSDFAKFVSTICTDLERLVAAQQAAAAKNSGTTSAPA